MKINFNWGHGIIVFLVIFFILAFSFIFFSLTQQKDLVVDDYYPREIVYQEHIDKVQNMELLGEYIIQEKENDMLILTFPDTLNKSIIGEIYIYRPSNADMDKKIPIETDANNRQMISTAGMDSGRYLIKIDFVHDGIGFYQEMYYFK